MGKIIEKIKGKILDENIKKHLKSVRKRNKNLNPTIICNNCIGGVIYHNLGLKFNSPTINLVLRGGVFLSFVKNLEEYLKAPIEELESTGVPMGKLIPENKSLPEIEIEFTHYKTFEDAKRKWETRKQRVNLDNVFFIWEFYDDLYDEKLVYEFDKLPIKKVIFTHREFPDLKNGFYLSCYKDGGESGKSLQFNGLSGKRYFEDFDYVKFLNEGRE